MKYLFIALILIGCVACHVNEIECYQDDNYISFVNKSSDTVVISFFMLGNLTEYRYPIPVRNTGIPQKYPMNFKIAVDARVTSMKEGFYHLPDECLFRPMSHLDTFYIQLKNYPALSSETAVLQLNLLENENFRLGDRDYRSIYLKINDNVVRPDWWTDGVERYYLGSYSEKKFRLLVEVVKPDLTDTKDAWIRSWALEFKEWLSENPTQDESGDLMSVPVKI